MKKLRPVLAMGQYYVIARRDETNGKMEYLTWDRKTNHSKFFNKDIRKAFRYMERKEARMNLMAPDEYVYKVWYSVA